MLSQINTVIAAGQLGMSIRPPGSVSMSKPIALNSWLKISASSAMPALLRLPLEQIDHFSFLVGQSVHEFPLRRRNVSFQAFRSRKGQINQKTNNK
jgi:hypothetical protein